MTICSLHRTTKGKDIHDKVKKSVDKIGGFISVHALSEMAGGKYGFIRLFRESGVNCPTYYCIIHQMALCGKSVKVSEVGLFKTQSK